MTMLKILSTKVKTNNLTLKENWCNRYFCRSNEVNLLLSNTMLCNKKCNECNYCKSCS